MPRFDITANTNKLTNGHNVDISYNALEKVGTCPGENHVHYNNKDKDIVNNNYDDDDDDSNNNNNNRILSSSQDGTKKHLTISLQKGLCKTAG